MTTYGPRLRDRTPVLRWYVIEPRSDDVYDGPYVTRADAEPAVEEYRDSFGSEPKVEQREITPVYDARNRASKVE